MDSYFQARDGSDHFDNDTAWLAQAKGPPVSTSTSTLPRFDATPVNGAEGQRWRDLDKRELSGRRTIEIVRRAPDRWSGGRWFAAWMCRAGGRLTTVRDDRLGTAFARVDGENMTTTAKKAFPAAAKKAAPAKGGATAKKGAPAPAKAAAKKSAKG